MPKETPAQYLARHAKLTAERTNKVNAALLLAADAELSPVHRNKNNQMAVALQRAAKDL